MLNPASSNFGLNLWFDGAGTHTCSTPPDVSANVTPGAAQSASANRSATTTSRCVPASGGSRFFIQGANTLSWTTGIYAVQLADFRVLGKGWDAGSVYTLGAPSGVHRVSGAAVGANGFDDTCGTMTLTVTAASSSVPEPSTSALFGSGLVVLGAAARRRRP